MMPLGVHLLLENFVEELNRVLLLRGRHNDGE
jgi:hypothetical protein